MIGELVGGYRIVAELGSGGMGRVYAAIAPGDVPGIERGTRVAIKIVHPHLFDVPAFRERFLREVEIGRAVNHPNVVQTLEGRMIRHRGEPLHVVVTEYVRGQTLRALLRELRAVPERLCRRIGREVATGLAAIHSAGILHRDLKPENVLITPESEIKVMDLGMARLQEEAHRLSEAGVFVGSVLYAAPEQFGACELDHRADLHALGVLLYELASGRHPYAGGEFSVVLGKLLHDEPRPLSAAGPRLSPFFDEFVRTLLAKSRDERFDSAETARHVLDAAEDSRWWAERSAARRRANAPLRRLRVPRETLFRGRGAELERLETSYEAARRGAGRVLLLEGEAGVGKTRLVDEFTRRLRERRGPFHFLFGAYAAGGAATAAGAFSTAYRNHFGAHGLERALRPHLAGAPSLIPPLAAVLRGEAAPENGARVPIDAVFDAFVDATRGLAREQPTIVLIEDLHHAPDEGLTLFATLTQALGGHRILLLGTTRRGLRDAWRANLLRLAHAGSLIVARLPDDVLREVVEDVLGPGALALDLTPQILRRADGNPFFALEIIHALRDCGMIARDSGGRWSATRAIAELELPPQLADLATARIGRLTDEERHVIDVAACCGFEFDSRIVGDAVQMPRVPLLKLLGRLERRDFLVRSVGMLHVFDHHLVQEAIYARLSEPLKRAYHAAIGATLKESYVERGENGALAVAACEHLLRGGRGERALPHLVAALDHLEHGYQHEQAAALARAALAVPDLVRPEMRAELEARARRNRRGAPTGESIGEPARE